MISIVVPTKNRHELIGRLLRYLHTHEFGGSVFVGDSSDDEKGSLVLNRRLVDKLSDRLDISYFEMPLMDPTDCMSHLIRKVTTRYTAITMDDDFLIPDSLTKCINFLEKNSDYVSAHGEGIKIHTKNDGVFGEIVKVGLKRQLITEETKPSNRYLHAMVFISQKYSTDLHFSVHRTERLKEAFNIPEMRTFAHAFRDRYMNWYFPIIGKVKGLDCLSVVRHIRGPGLHYHSPSKNAFNWINSEGFTDEYNLVTQRLAETLAEAEGITIESASNIVAVGLQYEIGGRIVRESKRKIPLAFFKDHVIEHRLPYKIGRRLFVSCSRQILRAISLRAAKQKYTLSLPSLLSKQHPYNHNFMGVYNSVNPNKFN